MFNNVCIFCFILEYKIPGCIHDLEGCEIGVYEHKKEGTLLELWSFDVCILRFLTTTEKGKAQCLKMMSSIMFNLTSILILDTQEKKQTEIIPYQGD